MDTDRHRPQTDCRTILIDLADDEENRKIVVTTTKQQPAFKHPLLERISLFSSSSVNDIVKLSHVSQHFQEFAHHFSVKTFKNLVRRENSATRNAMNTSSSSSSSSSSTNDLLNFYTPGTTFNSLQIPNHVEKVLNVAIQPPSTSFEYNSNASTSGSRPTPQPISWLVRSIVSGAGFFGVGFGALDQFSSESFCRLPIHRAIIYNHLEVVRLMLRKAMEMMTEASSIAFVAPSPIQVTLLATDSTGSTILHYAVQLKQESLVALILEYSNKIDRLTSPKTTTTTSLLLSATDDQGCNVFHAAARSASSKNVTILKMLLQNLKVISKSSSSPLLERNLTKVETPLEAAIRFYNKKAVKTFMREMVISMKKSNAESVEDLRTVFNLENLLSLATSNDDELKKIIRDGVKDYEDKFGSKIVKNIEVSKIEKVAPNSTAATSVPLLMLMNRNGVTPRLPCMSQNEEEDSTDSSDDDNAARERTCDSSRSDEGQKNGNDDDVLENDCVDEYDDDDDLFDDL